MNPVNPLAGEVGRKAEFCGRLEPLGLVRPIWPAEPGDPEPLRHRRSSASPSHGASRPASFRHYIPRDDPCGKDRRNGENIVLTGGEAKERPGRATQLGII